MSDQVETRTPEQRLAALRLSDELWRLWKLVPSARLESGLTTNQPNPRTPDRDPKVETWNEKQLPSSARRGRFPPGHLEKQHYPDIYQLTRPCAPVDQAGRRRTRQTLRPAVLFQPP